MPNLKSVDKLREYLRNKENDELYVLNTSHLKGKRRRSECAFTINAEGRSEHVLIKDTFIPQNIAFGFGSLEVFLRSREFINFVDMGFLEVIDPDAAREYLRTPEARTETMRVFDLDDDDVGLPPSAKATRKINASPKVVSIMMNNSMDSTRKISAFKNIVSELTADDKSWIMSQAQEENIKTYIQSLK